MRTFRYAGWLLVVILAGGCCCPSPCGVDGAGRPVARGAPEAEPDAPAPAVPQEIEPAAPSPAVAKEIEVAAVLSKKRLRGLQWDKVSLTSAVTYLRTVTGLAFVVSEKAMEEKHDDIVITLALDDVAVSTVLYLVTEPQGLRWELRDGTVWISTTDDLEGPIRLRYFDIGDLIRPEQEHGYASLDDAVGAIERTVFPAYWRREGVSLEGRGGSEQHVLEGAGSMQTRQAGVLIVRASGAVHDAIEERLQDERHEIERPGLSDAMRRELAGIRVTLSVRAKEAREVVAMLRVQTGINLMIDPRIASDVAGVPLEAIDVEDEPLPAVLDMLVRRLGAECVLVDRGRVLVLTTPEFVR